MLWRYGSCEEKGKHSMCLRIPAGAPNRAWHQSFHHLGCAVQRCFSAGWNFERELNIFVDIQLKIITY